MQGVWGNSFVTFGVGSFLFKHSGFNVIALSLTAGKESDHILVMHGVIDTKTTAIVVGDFIEPEHHFFPRMVQSKLATFFEEVEGLTI